MIDARYLGASSGIGVYTYHVIDEILKQDNEIKLTLLVHPKLKESQLPPTCRHNSSRIKIQKFGAEPNGLWTRHMLSHRADFTGIDLFHSPFNILPGRLPVPAVMTLHDIMWLINTEYCTDIWWRKMFTAPFYQTYTALSVREAAAILSVSKTSKKEIEDFFPDLKAPVSVSYNAVNDAFKPATELAPKHNQALGDLLQKRFVLMVGQSSPYKNQTRAVEAFVKAFGDDPSVHLVMVRRMNRSDESLMQSYLQSPQMQGRFHEFRGLDFADLLLLYQHCSIFLMPSLYEGFGIPIIEAMACGRPVVTSDIGAMAEVAGNAAAKVNPYKVDDIVVAMKRIIDDPAYAKDLSQRSLKRAAEFTWQACGKAVLAAYQNALG